MIARFLVLETPLGPLFVGASERGLHRVAWAQTRTERERLCAALAADAGVEPREGADADLPVLGRAAAQLRSYFAGERSGFDLPLAPTGTEFQRAVWQRLCAIPPGETATYGAVAGAVGRPRAARATGAAIGRNPLAVVVPCHRVIGADGSLTGFASGLDRKRWLLTHEGAGAAAANGDRPAARAPDAAGAEQRPPAPRGRRAAARAQATDAAARRTAEHRG